MSHSAEFWCSRRLLVTVDGPQGKSVIPLARPFARIGREAGSDVVLSSPWAARRSLYLHATDEGVYCFYLQPEETQSQRLGFWLAPGEPLLVGPYQISATLEGDPPGPAPALVPLDEWGSAHGPYPVFQVYSAGKLRDKRKFRARLNLIGRRHECALQIKGQQVSAFHGALYWRYPRLWYVDLVSSNGSILNGERIDFAEIKLGDRLTVGEFSLLFQRLSKSGGARSSPRVRLPGQHPAAEILPADVDEDMPLELDDQLAAELDDSQSADSGGSSPVIALDSAETSMPQTAASRWQTSEPGFPNPTQDCESIPAKSGEEGPYVPAVTIPQETVAPAASGDQEVVALAPVVQTRQELALLQQRVEELSKQTAQAGKNAVQHLAQTTHAAFERERQRIAQELEHRAGELAKEKLALEAKWQAASRELATQVSQLRDEATLLARQRQEMEKSRLLWEVQRREFERQLRLYAEQLRRLEHSATSGLPPPTLPHLNGPMVSAGAGLVRGSTTDWPSTAGAARIGFPMAKMASVEENEAATAMVLAASQQGGILQARSHVVDAHVDFPPVNSLQNSGLPHVGKSPANLPSPAISTAEPQGNGDLEGSLIPQSAVAERPADSNGQSPARTIRGRKTSKGKDAFDEVTDRMVEMEQGRRNSMVVLGIAISAAVVVLAAAIVVTAVLLR